MKRADLPPRRLVIVGNQRERPVGRTGPAMRREIDGYDTVVRFNEIKNRKRHWIGSRTDILFMRNEGATAHRIATGPLDIPSALVPKKIIFSMSPESLRAVGDPRPDWPDPYRTVLFHDELLAKPALAGIDHSFVDTALVIETYAFLKRRAGGRPTIPTLGFLAIRHFMQNPIAADSPITLVGFTFRGWKGHDWALEQTIAREVATAGTLVLL